MEKKVNIFRNCQKIISEIPKDCENFQTARGIYNFHYGAFLGLKIGKKITKKEFIELMDLLRDKISKRVFICSEFIWFWQKEHRHTKKCYRKIFKTWRELENGRHN